MRKKIIVGISSGIAAYKVVDLIKLLKNAEREVYVVMTENAAKMVSVKTLEQVSGHKVYLNLFEKNFSLRNILKFRTVEHINLAQKADVFVIVPATANIIGKIASGIADDFLTTSLIATNAPVIICPSMNSVMWNNPVVIENIEKLKRYGYLIFPPSSGKLACGVSGVGRLPEIDSIVAKIEEILEKKQIFKGKKVLVTAGATREEIDAVRVITNKSSGKMGKAIACESYLLGAEVLLLRAKTSVGANYSIREEIFETSSDLTKLIKKHIKNYDYFFHTAAVSDFIPDRKIGKKLDSNRKLTLRLKPATKILHEIKKWNPQIILVGFKAVFREEEKNLIKIGKEKLEKSRADFIIVNDVGKEGVGFDSEYNEVYVISQKGLLGKIEKSPKREIARRIIEMVIR